MRRRLTRANKSLRAVLFFAVALIIFGASAIVRGSFADNGVYDITVTKKLTGDEGSGVDFSFTVQFMDEDVYEPYANQTISVTRPNGSNSTVRTDANGEVDISLSEDQNYTFKNLPTNVLATVTENIAEAQLDEDVFCTTDFYATVNGSEVGEGIIGEDDELPPHYKVRLSQYSYQYKTDDDINVEVRNNCERKETVTLNIQKKFTIPEDFNGTFNPDMQLTFSDENGEEFPRLVIPISTANVGSQAGTYTSNYSIVLEKDTQYCITERYAGVSGYGHQAIFHFNNIDEPTINFCFSTTIEDEGDGEDEAELSMTLDNIYDVSYAGTLFICKYLVGGVIGGGEDEDEGSNDQMFDFRVTVAGASGNHEAWWEDGREDEIVFENGVATFQLLGDSCVEITGLELGAQYTAQEINIPDGWYLSRVEADVNEDGDDFPKTVDDNNVIHGRVAEMPGSDYFWNDFDDGSSSAVAIISGVKNLTGREFMPGDLFSFTLEAETSGAPMPASSTVEIEPTSGNTYEFFFEGITFTDDMAGSYTYNIVENDTYLFGVTYDDQSHYVYVNVSVEDDGGVLVEVTYNDGNSVIINNTYTSEEISIEVCKEWDDNFNQDYLRPDYVTVNLLRDGQNVYDDLGELLSAELFESDNWCYTFYGLPSANGEGTPYTYSVEEDVVPDGYSVSYSDDGYGHITVINSHATDTTWRSVQKVWDDDSDALRLRPSSILVYLCADGVCNYGNPVVLNEENNWYNYVTDLPIYNSGEEINYTWTEEDIQNYEQKSYETSSTDPTFTIITNKVIAQSEELGTLTVTNSVAGNLGDTNKYFDIDVTFYCWNETQTVSLMSGQSYTFNNIDSNCQYSVIEDPSTSGEYEVTYSSPSGYDTVNHVGYITPDSAQYVNIRNKRSGQISTGVKVNLSPVPFVIITMIFSAFVIYIRRRRRYRDRR